MSWRESHSCRQDDLLYIAKVIPILDTFGNFNKEPHSKYHAPKCYCWQQCHLNEISHNSLDVLFNTLRPTKAHTNITDGVTIDVRS